MSARRGEASGTFCSALKIFEPDASKYAARHLLMRQKLNPVFSIFYLKAIIFCQIYLGSSILCVPLIFPAERFPQKFDPPISSPTQR